jgi:hypothetical protein
MSLVDIDGTCPSRIVMTWARGSQDCCATTAVLASHRGWRTLKGHAHDRFLPEWFNRIRSRQITLPRFQRFVAWGHKEVSGLLTTVLRGLPSGAALILEVGDEEKFKSRTMVDAPESGENVAEQILDGPKTPHGFVAKPP